MFQKTLNENSTKHKNLKTKFLEIRELGIVAMILIVFIVTSLIQPRFMQWENIRNILLFMPIVAVTAMGQMLIILSRNYDLSVGSTLAFSAVSIGIIYKYYNPTFPLPLAFILGIVIGLILGAINGIIITKLKLPSIIVTLGTLSVYRGGIFILGGGHQIDPQDVPDSLIQLSISSPVIVPWTVIFTAIIILACYVFLKYSHLGREIYAVGGNYEAAKLRGINVNFVTFIVFTICGGLAGFAGILYGARFGMMNPNNTGLGMELTVIAAVVIGGTSVKGGSGSVFGVTLGCLLLGVLTQMVAVIGLQGTWQKAIYGLVIIVALGIDKVVQDQLTRNLERGELI